MIIKFNKLGKLGRLGNQLFQVASTLGISETYGATAIFPFWEYSKYFKGYFHQNDIVKSPITVTEKSFNYNDFNLIGSVVNIEGYLQSERYWEHVKHLILKKFIFNDEFSMTILLKHIHIFQKTVIGIHIRRGDYVGNENYVELDKQYYMDALNYHFSGWYERYNLLIFSDDPEYAKEQFGHLENAHFPLEMNDISDLCLMSFCNHYIIANSSFSWWAAYLGSNRNNGKVVRPSKHFSGPMANTDISDLYPSNWIAL